MRSSSASALSCFSWSTVNTTGLTVDADGAPNGSERILVGGLGRTIEGGSWTGKAYVFDWESAIHYLDGISYLEPMFVVVIMASLSSQSLRLVVQ